MGLLSTLFCPVKLPYTVQLNCNQVSEHLSFAILGASTDAWSHSNFPTISDDLLCPKILVNGLNITLFKNKPICYSVQLGFLTIAIELKYLKFLFGGRRGGIPPKTPCKILEILEILEPQQLSQYL